MAEEAKGIILTALKLFVICLVATLILAGINLLTKDKIAENDKIAFNEGCEAVLPAKDYETVELTAPEDYAGDAKELSAVAAKDENGDVIGLCVKQSVKGYNSGLVFMTGILTDGTVSGIRIMSHEETPGLGASADSEEFTGKYNGLPTPVEDKVMVKTGATKTSEGIRGGVNAAAAMAKDYFEKEGIGQ